MDGKREKLVEARYRKGWSQEEAAEQIGVGRTTLSALERGMTNPHPFHIMRLCETYETTTERLGLVKEQDGDIAMSEGKDEC